MSTRSLTVFKERWKEDDKSISEEIVVMYRQMDGYPSGHGVELAEFLKEMVIVNGVPVGAETAKIANGMSCLAAQVVSYFKDQVGNIYLYRAETRDCGEEYIYTIENREKLIMTVRDVWGKKDLFKGTPKEFLNNYVEK